MLVTIMPEIYPPNARQTPNNYHDLMRKWLCAAIQHGNEGPIISNKRPAQARNFEMKRGVAGARRRLLATLSVVIEISASRSKQNIGEASISESSACKHH